MAACTRLVEALARGEIAGPEGAAVHMARGNLYAVRREVDRAIADYDTRDHARPRPRGRLLQPR